MRSRIGTALVLLALTIVFCFGFAPLSTSAQDKAQPQGKWEYKIVKIAATAPTTSSPAVDPKTGVPVVPPVGTKIGGGSPGTISEANLTAMGEQGWELVAVTGGQPYMKTVWAGGTSGIGPNPPPTVNATAFSDTIYYFKRPK